MSRNFELLNQLAAESPFGGTVTGEAPTSAWHADQVAHHEIRPELLTLAQTLFLSGQANAPHAVVLCGVDSGNSSSEICVQLGRALAHCSPRPVCLVGTDSDSARMETLLSAVAHVPPPDADTDGCRSVDSNLWLAEIHQPASPDENGGASAQRLRGRLADLRARFEFILIDAPGAHARGDGAHLAQLSDGAILVVEANRTRRASALRARQSLERLDIRVLGSVLNNRTYPIPTRLYRWL